MPRYEVTMQNGHVLTIEAPNLTHAMEVAARHAPGVGVLGGSYVGEPTVEEDTTDTTAEEGAS